MKKVAFVFLAVPILLVSGAISCLAMEIIGQVSGLDQKNRTITVERETTGPGDVGSLILPVTDETQPWGLRIFENIVVGDAIRAKAEIDEEGTVIKTNYLEVIGRSVPL